MNKGRRHELKMLKYKKRLKLYGLKEGENTNLHAYRSHGAPCSCSVCSHSKYERSKTKIDIEKELRYEGEGGEDDIAHEIMCHSMYEVDYSHR